MDIVVGQRWVSHTEHRLGLGIITEISGRLITIDFPAAEEQRTYARNNAPLSRIEYSVGETIADTDGRELTILEVLHDKGLIGYVCQDNEGREILIPEIALDSHVHFTTPRQRLISGQFDGNSAFRLRLQTLNLVHELQQSSVRGLAAGRMQLLPHQLYIAHEVAQRYAPRILLADEVGLGKTIEAAMIIHYQLLSHQARRVLILVPESLMHQWLVELLRRFSLKFKLFNQQRLETYLEDDTYAENPFESEQLVISSLDTILSDPTYANWLRASDWDMLVVDEAHHLAWSVNNPSPAYAMVENLAAKIRSVLLLTATPEQIGAEGHFARLRLLDAQRYSDLNAFLDEELDYKSLNSALERIENIDFSDDFNAQDVFHDFRSLFPTHLYQKLIGLDAENQEDMIQNLLDLHGTGRVLFRNQRRNIKGFPKRHVHPQALVKPQNWSAQGLNSLFPEQQFSDENWLNEDPRISWLVNFLKANKRRKLLVICHHDETAQLIDKHLNLRHGIRSTSFYPELSIIERDRAAAYFAEEESGAQCLICSEIGSEGRNFQFAQDLVLFDLPLNPDLVEQRIGRLDRIGQSDDIQIHIPYIETTAQATLFHWFHDGLDLFRQPASAAYAIFSYFERELIKHLEQTTPVIDELIAKTKTHRIKLNHELQEGRDRLLERNSFDKEHAETLVSKVEAKEQDDKLAGYMRNVFNEYGIEVDEHSEDTIIIRPSEQMRDVDFPGLKDAGQTITFQRSKAISREDYDFLTWEHPMVQESMAAIYYGELGNAAVASIKIKGLKSGTVLLESIHSVFASAPRHLQLEQYLPISPQRLLTNISGKDLSGVVSHSAINQLLRKIPREVARQAIQQLRKPIQTLVEKAESSAGQKLEQYKEDAKARVAELLNPEIERMKSLAERNPNIRESEIQYLEQRKKGCPESSQT